MTSQAELRAISEFLAMTERGIEDDKPRDRIPPEAAIATLKEAHERILAGNPFKVGDIVTLRADAMCKGRGEPHLVIGVDPAGYYAGENESGDWGTVMKRDLHVLCFSESCERVASHVLCSWMCEPFTE